MARKTFDELQKGDLIIETIYNQHDVVKYVNVHKVTSVENKGNRYKNGIEYTNIQVLDEHHDTTLPRFRSFVNFRDFGENDYTTYETIDIDETETEQVLDELNDIKTKLFVRLGHVKGQHVFDAVLETEQDVQNKIIKLETLQSARKWYNIRSQIRDDDGHVRKELTDEQLEELREQLHRYSCIYEPVKDY